MPDIRIAELSCLPPEPVKPKSIWAACGPIKGIVPWIILGAFGAFWVIFFSFMPPQAGGPDVFVFRDAGCNWAHGRGLVAASVPHANTVVPVLFASYTPGSLLLFGVAAKLFGCTGPVDTFYNLALAEAAVLLLYLCFSQAVTSSWQRVCASLLLGAVIPTGMVAFDADRPEMPAFALLIGIFLLWRYSATIAAKSLLFGLAGLVFLIHPFAGIVGWLLLVFLLFFGALAAGYHTRTAQLQIMTLGSILCAVIVAAWALWMWRQDHTSLHRFLEHAAGQGTGAGVVLHGAKEVDAKSTPTLHNGYAVAFRQLFNPAFPEAAALAISLLLSALVVALYAFRGPERRRLVVECGILLLVLVVFPFAVFPGQANYLGLSRALLLGLLLVGGFPLANALRGSRAPLALVVIAFLFTVPWVLLEILQNVETRASYYHEQEQAKRVRAYFDQRGMRAPALLVDSGHYFVYKPYFRNLYNPNYLEPGDAMEEIRGLVLCYSGSRAFSRAQLPWVPTLTANQWTLVDGDDEVARVALFGHPIMRRNWSRACDFYARQ